ncbi:hypothetical protein ACM0CO_19395 [Mycobacteroides abscessus subsp. abscessus]|uniref:hypothetical protein n=1 Tax=Mycobacteroides abscessus TaxID=36809 RepID=UPI0039EE4F0E
MANLVELLQQNVHNNITRLHEISDEAQKLLPDMAAGHVDAWMLVAADLTKRIEAVSADLRAASAQAALLHTKISPTSLPLSAVASAAGVADNTLRQRAKLLVPARHPELRQLVWRVPSVPAGHWYLGKGAGGEAVTLDGLGGVLRIVEHAPGSARRLIDQLAFQADRSAIILDSPPAKSAPLAARSAFYQSISNKIAIASAEHREPWEGEPQRQLIAFDHPLDWGMFQGHDLEGRLRGASRSSLIVTVGQAVAGPLAAWEGDSVIVVEPKVATLSTYEKSDTASKTIERKTRGSFVPCKPTSGRQNAVEPEESVSSGESA